MADVQQGGGLPVQRVEGGARGVRQTVQHAEGLEAGHVLGLAEADQQGHADADGRGVGTGAGQLPGGPPGGGLVGQGEPCGVGAQGAVGHGQVRGPSVDGVGGPYRVGVGQER